MVEAATVMPSGGALSAISLTHQEKHPGETHGYLWRKEYELRIRRNTGWKIKEIRVTYHREWTDEHGHHSSDVTYVTPVNSLVKPYVTSLEESSYIHVYDETLTLTDETTVTGVIVSMEAYYCHVDVFSTGPSCGGTDDYREGGNCRVTFGIDDDRQVLLNMVISPFGEESTTVDLSNYHYNFYDVTITVPTTITVNYRFRPSVTVFWTASGGEVTLNGEHGEDGEVVRYYNAGDTAVVMAYPNSGWRLLRYVPPQTHGPGSQHYEIRIPIHDDTSVTIRADFWRYTNNIIKHGNYIAKGRYGSVLRDR